MKNLNISQAEYAARRQKFFVHLPENSVAVIPTARVCYKTTDNEYPYHPNNNLYYLTGYSEPNCVAVFVKEERSAKFILFNLPKVPEEEIWHGRRVGQIGAMSEFSADQAFSIHDFENEIRRLLQGKEKLFFTLGNDENYDAMMIRVTKTLKENARREGSTVPLALVDVDHIIAEMRLIKSPAEIELLRLAAQISVAAHQRAMKICKPGLNESQIAAELIYGFMAEGCQDESYNSIVACGGNGVVLHYSANNALLEDGMLLLVDAGGEYRFYDADITTTYPVSGKFSPPQKMIYDLVLKAQSAAFALIKPGTRWVALQEAIVQVLTQGLLELGILQGELHELLLNREFFKFYMHNSGHWLGLDTHDVGAYKINGESRILQPGMVLTVEPGLYFSKDTAGLDPKWHDIAVRIEDDVVVTATGYEILSAGLPRTTEAIEAFMAQKY